MQLEISMQIRMQRIKSAEVQGLQIACLDGVLGAEPLVRIEGAFEGVDKATAEPVKEDKEKSEGSASARRRN